MLVTGASGYLGRRVAAALADLGPDLHLVSRRPPAGTIPRATSNQPATAVWHQADLLEPGATDRLIAEVRPVMLLHLAWDVTPGVYWASPENARWRDATIALATAFYRAGGRRFAGAGTCAEYDWTHGLCDEASTPIAPASPYGLAKAAAWRGVARAAEETGGEPAWGRVFFPFGGVDEHPSRLVPSVLGAIRRGEPALCSPGDQRRDFLHADDVAAAFVALARSRATGAMNLGSGEARTVREVVEGLADRLGRRDLIRLGARPADPVPLVVARVDRLTDEVGWRPALSFEESLDRAAG